MPTESDLEDIVLVCDDNVDSGMQQLLSETLGKLLIDSGCSKTVAGEFWIKQYIDSLSVCDRKSIRSEPSSSKFRFGDGKTFESIKLLHLPIHIGNASATLQVDVVPCDIPLLLSRESLKKSNAKLNFTNDTITIFDQCLPLENTSSGHYCISISRSTDLSASNIAVQKIFFSSFKLDIDDTNCKTKVAKLHKQYGHACPDDLIKLMNKAGITDSKIHDIVKQVSGECEFCC